MESRESVRQGRSGDRTEAGRWENAMSSLKSRRMVVRRTEVRTSEAHGQ